MKNILVVEDSKPILEYIRRKIAAKSRFRFFGADSFAVANELISNNTFFAAIVDLELPDAKSGAALDLTIKNGIPSIVLTGSMNHKLRDEIINKPIVDYIHKDSMEMIDQAIQMIFRLEYYKNKKAFIVSKDSQASDSIAAQLSKLLFDVTQFDNCESALEAIHQNKDVAIIVADNDVQPYGGIEFVKKVRSKFSENSILIFGIDEIGNEESRYSFLKSGATTYISKPIVKEELVSKITNNMRFLEQNENLSSYINKVDKYVITSITDTSGTIKYASEAFCDISGYDKQELLGKKHNILRHPDMPASIYKNLWETISSKKTWTGEIKNLKKDGGYYWVRANIEPILDSDGEIVGYQAIRQDITDKKTIETMSITDELTGLYNRRYFNSILPQMIEDAKSKGSYLSFFIMDVDNFKKYNDTYGHMMGDSVLGAVGTTMRGSLNTIENIAFRLGGEEFGGILANTDGPEGAKELVEAIRFALENLKIEHSKNTASPFVTASFGLIIADFSNGKNIDVTQDVLYAKADELLYEAKESGRNRLAWIAL